MRGSLSGLTRSLAAFSRGVYTIASLTVIVMVFAYVLPVVGRWMGVRISGTFELNEMVMVLCVFLSLAYAQSEKRHVNVTLLTNYLSPRRRHLLDACVLFIALLFLLFVTYLNLQDAIKAFQIGEYRQGDMKYPVWPFKFALTFGLFMFAAQIAADIGNNVKRMLHPSSDSPAGSPVESGEKGTLPPLVY